MHCLMAAEGRQSGGGVSVPPFAPLPGLGSGAAVAQSLVAPTSTQLQPAVQSLSAAQFTIAAWQRNSFEGSQMQLGSEGGGGLPPSAESALPPALPLHAHCSPAGSQVKPDPQSLAVVHGKT